MYTEMFGMFFNSLLYTDQVLWELYCILADGAYLGISNAVRNSIWKSQSLHKFNLGLFLKPHERHNIEICEIVKSILCEKVFVVNHKKPWRNILEYVFQKDIDLVWNSYHVYIAMIKLIHFTKLSLNVHHYLMKKVKKKRKS